MKRWTNERDDGAGGTTLDRAIDAWRSSPGPTEGLSERTRGAIHREFRDAAVRPRAHAALFVPVARLALGAAVPVLVLSLLAGSILLTPPPAERGTLVAGAPRVDVAKAGGEVVFLIHNGGRTHRISKSTVPGPERGAESFTTTTGRFSDRLESESSIVYYRID